MDGLVCYGKDTARWAHTADTVVDFAAAQRHNPKQGHQISQYSCRYVRRASNLERFLKCGSRFGEMTFVHLQEPALIEDLSRVAELLRWCLGPKLEPVAFGPQDREADAPACADRIAEFGQ